MKKLFTITLLIIFSGFTNISYSETLNFGSIKYDGDVKKGKAHGEMCILHEDEDGDLVPVSLEEVEGHKVEKELKIEQYKLN